MENQQMPINTGNDNNDKMAFVAYITIFGFLIAILTTNKSERNPLLKFHLRQALGLFLTGLIISALSIIPILGWILAPLCALVLIIFVIIAFINAINKEMKPLPILGQKYQEWFAHTF